MQYKQKSERIYYISSRSNRVTNQKNQLTGSEEVGQQISSARHYKLSKLKSELKAMQQQYKIRCSQVNLIDKKIQQKMHSYRQLCEKKQKYALHKSCNQIKKKSHHIVEKNIYREQQRVEQIRLRKQNQRKVSQLKKMLKSHINQQIRQKNRQDSMMMKQQANIKSQKLLQYAANNYKNERKSYCQLLGRKKNIEEYALKQANQNKAKKYLIQKNKYSELNKNYEQMAVATQRSVRKPKRRSLFLT